MYTGQIAIFLNVFFNSHPLNYVIKQMTRTDVTKHTFFIIRHGTIGRVLLITKYMQKIQGSLSIYDILFVANLVHFYIKKKKIA